MSCTTPPPEYRSHRLRATQSHDFQDLSPAGREYQSFGEMPTASRGRGVNSVDADRRRCPPTGRGVTSARTEASPYVERTVRDRKGLSERPGSILANVAKSLELGDSRRPLRRPAARRRASRPARPATSTSFWSSMAATRMGSSQIRLSFARRIALRLRPASSQSAGMPFDGARSRDGSEEATKTRN